MVLRFLIQLLMLKAKHGWSDTSFSDLLQLLGSLLSKPNFVPKSTYEAKMMVSPLSMRVQRIHACRNHCMLFYGDNAGLENCTSCGPCRYKNNTDFSPVEGDQPKKRKRGEKKNGGVPHVEDDTCVDVDKN